VPLDVGQDGWNTPLPVSPWSGSGVLLPTGSRHLPETTCDPPDKAPGRRHKYQGHVEKPGGEPGLDRCCGGAAVARRGHRRGKHNPVVTRRARPSPGSPRGKDQRTTTPARSHPGSHHRQCLASCRNRGPLPAVDAAGRRILLRKGRPHRDLGPGGLALGSGCLGLGQGHLGLAPGTP